MTPALRKLFPAPVKRLTPREQDPLDKRCDCAVSLIDRRTGQTPHVNGRPVMVVTRDPSKAIADLLQGRDRTIWDVRVQALHPGFA